VHNFVENAIIYIQRSLLQNYQNYSNLNRDLINMTKKFFSLLLMAAVVILGVAFVGAETSSAQVATFPSGCSSALGYSITTGAPCNGTATATLGPLPGCTTALGFSVTNGAPCSGGPIAISFLAGCSSVFGYSVITGAPCNGTTVATVSPFVPPVVIGLPTTGEGNALSNIMLLLVTGSAAAYGMTRLARRYNFS